MEEKRQSIFKELKRRMNYLQDELGYEVLFIALQGSQNYGMDIYTEEYKSDIDCMAVVLPSFDNFVDNSTAVSTTLVLDNNEHINIKDIRLMFELFYKQNPQFLELLFTDYKIINKKYKLEVQPLFANADKIASYNLLKLYNGISGMAKEKQKAMEHPYPSIIDKINKYGYDGKQLHHIIRLYQFIINLICGLSYKEAMTYFDDNIRDMCIKAKLNKYSLEEARHLAEDYSQRIHSLKESYFMVNEVVIKDEVVSLLLDIKSNILKKFFKEDLLPDYKEPFKLCPDQYKNVWVTSDTHFGHTNILKYEEKRLNMLGVSLCNEITRYIIDNKLSVDNDEDFTLARAEVYKQLVKVHDNKLISNWNEKVKKEDLVIILGDFSFRNAESTNELLGQLNGDKVLIRGNHDIFLDDKKFDKTLFKAIYDYKEVKYKGQEIALMHYPIQDFKHQNKETNPSVLLFGHIHSNRMEIPKHSFNVGTDVNNYYPVQLSIAIEKALDNNGGVINGSC